MPRLLVPRSPAASPSDAAARTAPLPLCPPDAEVAVPAPALLDLLDAFEDRTRTCAAALHDAVLQDLYALRLGIPTLAPEALDARLAGIARAVSGLIERLSPPLLDDHGLAAALVGLARRSPQQIHIDLPAREAGAEADAECPALPLSAARGLFRVAQEGVESAARHASGARIRLAVERGAATLTVDEDAAGEDAAGEDVRAPPGAVPRPDSVADRLARLRAASYAQALGGTLAVCGPADPVRYRVRIPLGPAPGGLTSGGATV